MLLHSASRETGCVMHRSIIALCFISLKIKSASSGKSHGPWGSDIYKLNILHEMSTTRAASVKTSQWVYVNKKIHICIYKEVLISFLWKVSTNITMKLLNNGNETLKFQKKIFFLLERRIRTARTVQYSYSFEGFTIKCRMPFELYALVCSIV